MVVELPNLDHLSSKDYQDIYEPAEDTYLFVDALDEQKTFISKLNPHRIVELGPGSGAISTFLASRFPSSSFIAIDINPKAVEATRKTAKYNNVGNIDVIQGSLLDCIHDNSVDILMFNPPYVPSEPEEMDSSGIEAAWAGGIDGREIIDKLLPDVSVNNIIFILLFINSFCVILENFIRKWMFLFVIGKTK